MVDFINEVEDELRKDQYNVLLRKYGPFLAGLAIAIVAGTGLYEFYKTSDSRAARNASISYLAAQELADTGNETKAVEQFKAIGQKAKPGYAGLALTKAAALELDAGNAEAAVTLFDQAARSYDTPMHQQLSQYKAAMVLADLGRHDDVLQRVEPLAVSGEPFAYLARELRAFTYLAKSDTSKARSDFLYLSSSPGAPRGVQERATQMLQLTPSLIETTPKTIPNMSVIPSPEAVTAPAIDPEQDAEK